MASAADSALSTLPTAANERIGAFRGRIRVAIVHGITLLEGFMQSARRALENSPQRAADCPDVHPDRTCSHTIAHNGAFTSNSACQPTAHPTARLIPGGDSLRTRTTRVSSRSESGHRKERVAQKQLVRFALTFSRGPSSMSSSTHLRTSWLKERS